jgi:D-serine deaminase-like pyridoxal phosphate-dependent protein
MAKSRRTAGSGQDQPFIPSQRDAAMSVAATVSSSDGRSPSRFAREARMVPEGK